MPQVFKVGSYWVYFWANENEPLEPIHVHVAQGAPNSNATNSGSHARDNAWRYCWVEVTGRMAMETRT